MLINWEINEDKATDSDHEIILFSINIDSGNLIENPVYNNQYNFEKADWKIFAEELILQSNKKEFASNINISQISREMLETEAEKLRDIIIIAANKAISKKRIHEKSKPWWNEELKLLRKELANAKRQYKKNQNQTSQQAFQALKSDYFYKIKQAKATCWNDFLENAVGKDIFKAFNYTKFNRIEKLPIIQYQHENQEITAITFEQKCEAFMQVLFKKPPQSEAVNWNNYIEKDWEWPVVSKDEIKEAIFSSSTRKAAGPDKISFLILQKAFESIENRFVTLYNNLISYGYHPICWREAIGAILKKSNRKASLSKSYRVISLLNSMTKTAEKIIASRLAYLANIIDIVNFDQMSSRKQISAINAVMSLIHDIQLAKNDNKIISVLFMDVKEVYDHVSCNQLLKICKNLGLPRSLCSWIECFMNNRYVQLAFDENKQEKTRVEIEISQKSSISSILFLIYIRDIFSEINSMQIRSSSYVDDIELVASSETIEENYLMLENAAKKLLQLQNQNNIQFDMKKIELIHFHTKRSIDNSNFSVTIRNNQMQSKNLIRWLGVWLDSKLSFKEHVEIKISTATRIFHQIARLSNTERGLSFQAMKQLYIACITSVADYEVPIWWNNQKSLLEKYQKLQNAALRKILGAFKTSPYMAMELEAAIISPRARFNRLCKNYALRIMQIPKNHPIRLRVSASYPPYNNGAELDWEKYLDWNEKNQDIVTEIAETSSNSESEQRHRRKRRKVKRKSKKEVSQLFKITSKIAELLPFLKTERIKQKWNAS